MPVTARLSREFYEKFGDKVVDELVALFNQVDMTYRTELRELNEFTLARFDDRLERRLAEFRADLDRRLTDLDGRWDKRLSELEGRWDKRFSELEGRWAQRIGAIEKGWEQRLGDLRAELIKWMFIFWVGTVATLFGLFRVMAP